MKPFGREEMMAALQEETGWQGVSAKDYIENQLLKDIAENKAAGYIPTGFSNIDKELNGGLIQGKVYIIAAMPSYGKTDLTLQIADNIAKQGRKVLYFSLEMSKSELVCRSIARTISEENSESDITATDIQTGKKEIPRGYTEKYLETSGRLVIYEGDTNKYIMIENAIKKQLSELKDNEPKPVVFIDYLQYIVADGTNERRYDIDNIIRGIRKICRENKLAAVLVSSQNRTSYGSGKTGAEKLSSLKESGGLEYTADSVMILEIKDVEDMSKSPRPMFVEFAKNRQGQNGGKAYFKYYSANSRFEEATKKTYSAGTSQPTSSRAKI